MSRDLFGDRVLVERQAFMDAQVHTLTAQSQALTEEGWSQVACGQREQVQDRLYAMDAPAPRFDQATTQKLRKVDTRRKELSAVLEKLDDCDATRQEKLEEKFIALEAEEREILKNAPIHFSEQIKAVGTAFLILDPDGRVHREYRVPRRQHKHAADGRGVTGSDDEAVKPPTSDDLSDNQKATTFVHQTLAVREALLANPSVRKRLLALILHEKIRSEALARKPEANSVTIHAERTEGFVSPAWDALRKRRLELDPFAKEQFASDPPAYERLCKLPDKQIDALIELLTVECLFAVANAERFAAD